MEASKVLVYKVGFLTLIILLLSCNVSDDIGVFDTKDFMVKIHKDKYELENISFYNITKNEYIKIIPTNYDGYSYSIDRMKIVEILKDEEIELTNYAFFYFKQKKTAKISNTITCVLEINFDEILFGEPMKYNLINVKY
jgi:hypothetical protein